MIDKSLNDYYARCMEDNIMLLSTKEVAAELGLPRPAITELAKSGYLKGVIIGNSWAFERSEVTSFSKRNKG